MLDTAVAEEGPPTANIFRAFQINIDHLHDFLVFGGAIEHFTLRAGNEGTAPKLDAVSLSARIGLVSGAIDCNDGQTVGYGMAALYRASRWRSCSSGVSLLS